MELRTHHLYKTLILHSKNQQVVTKKHPQNEHPGVAISPSPLLVLPRHLSCTILKAAEHSALLEKLKATFYFMEVILGPQQSSCYRSIQFCRAVRGREMKHIRTELM